MLTETSPTAMMVRATLLSLEAATVKKWVLWMSMGFTTRVCIYMYVAVVNACQH